MGVGYAYIGVKMLLLNRGELSHTPCHVQILKWIYGRD